MQMDSMLVWYNVLYGLFVVLGCIAILFTGGLLMKELSLVRTRFYKNRCKKCQP